MHMQRQLYIIMAFYVAREKKELYISGAILGAQGNESQIKKGIHHWYAKDNKSRPAGCDPTLFHLLLCLSGYAVNKKEYGS